MSYVALYRAYRPQKFSEVAGQTHIVTTLQNAIKLNKVSHAYLFSGPRGTGKTTLAKIMAKAINCVHGPNIEPCNECDICIGITKGRISDVIEIDAASNNGVDEIREIRDKVKYLPSVGKYKVYIIDEVHMLSTGAFNALLKTLEEPPTHAIFILATTEPHKIPATILSRVQRFDFQSLSTEDIFKRLTEVALQEKINVESEALNIISEVCEGGMRDALSLLDQALSYSSDNVVSVSDVIAVSGNVSNELILDLLIACYESNGAKILEILGNVLKEGKEVSRVLNDLIIFLRDILMFKVDTLKDTKAIYKKDTFIEFAREINPAIIYNWLTILSDTQNNIRFSNQKRAFIELGLLKMADREQNDYATLVKKVEDLEKKIISLEDQPKQKIEKPKEYDIASKIVIPPKEEVKPVEIIKPTAANEFVQVKMIENVLNFASRTKKEQVIEAVRKISERNPNDIILNILCNGTIVAASEDVFIVTLADLSFCNRVMKYENFKRIMDLINKDSIIAKDYICLPVQIWEAISKDYKMQYAQNKEVKPVLKPIDILVKMHEIPNGAQEIDPLVNEAYDLFDEKIVKIKEEF